MKISSFPPLLKGGGPLAVEGFKKGIPQSASLTAPFNKGATCGQLFAMQ